MHEKFVKILCFVSPSSLSIEPIFSVKDIFWSLEAALINIKPIDMEEKNMT